MTCLSQVWLSWDLVGTNLPEICIFAPPARSGWSPPPARPIRQAQGRLLAAACPCVNYTAGVKRIRESQRVSQPIFARYLNTSESTVEKWESGVKKPSGMAVKLLTIVQKHGLQMLA